MNTDISTYPHVEERNGRYYVRGQRVPMTSIAITWNQGRSTETIAQDFPVLTLAEVYGAVTFYLDHRQLIDQHIAEDHISFEQARQAQWAADPQRYEELERRFALPVDRDAIAGSEVVQQVIRANTIIQQMLEITSKSNDEDLPVDISLKERVQQLFSRMAHWPIFSQKRRLLIQSADCSENHHPCQTGNVQYEVPMCHEKSTFVVPPLEELERLEMLAPGITNRLLSIVEEQERALMENERKVTEANIVAMKRYDNQIRLRYLIAFSLAILVLLVSIGMAWMSKNVILGIGTLMSSMVTIILGFLAQQWMSHRLR